MPQRNQSLLVCGHRGQDFGGVHCLQQTAKLQEIRQVFVAVKYQPMIEIMFCEQETRHTSKCCTGDVQGHAFGEVTRWIYHALRLITHQLTEKNFSSSMFSGRTSNIHHESRERYIERTHILESRSGSHAVESC